MEEEKPLEVPVVPKKRPVRQIRLTTAVVTALLVGVFGYIAGTRSQQIIAQLFTSSSSPAQLDFTSLNNLYSVLRSKHDGELDAAKLLDGAKHGLVDAVGDPYTVYLNAEEAKEFDSDLNGTFQGIGAELGKVDAKLTVQGIIGDSPAQKAGLKVNDVILKVNDEDVTSLTVGAAVQKIRGEKGTTVKLSVLRGDTPMEFTITRDTITSPSVTSEILDGNIGYMRISRFSEDTSGLARKAAEEFKSKGVSKVILDLRGNGGGLLTSSQEVAGLWLNNKVVVSERRNGIVTDTLRSGTNPVLEGIKTVVLVDGSSASASEIVAGALKDNGAATLVGEKTFGKGSVQIVVDLGDGSQLKVTVARWYTPNGKNINKEGIVPDKIVTISDADIAASRDTQKEAALELLL